MKRISHIATSFDGRIFATGEFKELVSIWDIDEGTHKGSFRTHLDYGGHRLAISPDGQLCAAGAYSIYGISVYNVPDGSVVWTRKDLKKVQWLGFDPTSGNLLAGFDSKPLHVLNSRTGETLETLRGVRQKKCNPYNDTCLVDGTKLEIRGNAGKPIVLQRCTFAILDGAFSPGVVYLTESGGPLRAIDCTNGALLWEYIPENGSHFPSIGYNAITKTLFGVLWPFEKGGAKTLWQFDPSTGLVISRMILEDNPVETEFAYRGSRLITSNGYIYRLEGDRQLPFSKFNVDE